MADDSFSFDSPHTKATYVNRMFARIAGHYDRMNRLMSLGRDVTWRRRAIELAAAPPAGRLLDVATGTGDVACLCLQRDPSLHVTGVDFTLEMMRLGQSKGDGLIGWTGGDALRLPYPDATFDAVISAFMMRNVTDIAAAFAEQRRVVRPGGRVVCLEMTHPTLPVWRDLYSIIFGRVMPLVSGFLSGQPDAYRYLPASVAHFMHAQELKTTMERVGLRGVGYQTLMLGAVAVHVGVK
jgi:demethylmenaquinone methyltransferase/2-methoxy-6-polyprenyl-1,4-benzoquinol methylase